VQTKIIEVDYGIAIITSSNRKFGILETQYYHFLKILTIILIVMCRMD